MLSENELQMGWVKMSWKRADQNLAGNGLSENLLQIG